MAQHINRLNARKVAHSASLGVTPTVAASTFQFRTTVAGVGCFSIAAKNNCAKWASALPALSRWP